MTIFTVLLCPQQHCQAQQPSASQSQSDGAAAPRNEIHWSAGPKKFSLGDFADIDVPAGSRLTDVHGARMILTMFNDAVPDDLVGIVAPKAGKWMAILEYSSVGYVKNPDLTQINTKTGLNQILNEIKKQEQSSVTSLSWQSHPAYDSRSHVMDWSLKVETPSSKILNQTAVMFGRRGVLQVTVVQHVSDATVPSLKQLLGCITFKNGERYADYKKGDNVAQIGLAELISGEKDPQAAAASGGGFGSVIGWTYSGLAVCFLTGTVVMIRRRTKAQRRLAPDPVSASVTKNKAIMNNANLSSSAVKSSKLIGPAQLKPASQHRHGLVRFHRRRRKKIFDYTKFYAKVFKNLSGHACPPSTSHVKFHSGSDSNSNDHGHAHANVHGNGGSNAHANDQSSAHAASHSTNVNQPPKSKSEIEDLITIQKALIANQNRLLEEQTRLIEEKRNLIEAQTAFLKAQSSVAVDPQGYPLKVAQQ